MSARTSRAACRARPSLDDTPRRAADRVTRERPRARGPDPTTVRRRSATAPVDDLTAVAAAAAQGDVAAVGALLTTIRPVVVRYCRARLRAVLVTTADDVAQEVCLAVLRALPGYRDRQRPFMAFVYAIAAHKVADAYRANNRNRADPVAELPEFVAVQAGPEQLALHAELSAHLGRLLQTLPARQREVIILRVAVGLTAEQTAELLDSTPGAVRVAQHRALSQLRKISRAAIDDRTGTLDPPAQRE